MTDKYHEFKTKIKNLQQEGQGTILQGHTRGVRRIAERLMARETDKDIVYGWYLIRNALQAYTQNRHMDMPFCSLCLNHICEYCPLRLIDRYHPEHTLEKEAPCSKIGKYTSRGTVEKHELLNFILLVTNLILDYKEVIEMFEDVPDRRLVPPAPPEPVAECWYCNEDLYTEADGNIDYLEINGNEYYCCMQVECLEAIALEEGLREKYHKEDFDNYSLAEYTYDKGVRRRSVREDEV